MAESVAVPASSLQRPTQTSALGHQRFDSGESRRAVLPTALGIAALAIPVAAYFWFIDRFSVNVIYWDQWSDVNVIGHPSIGNLWAQHLENRIFFPNLIVIVLAYTTHFNIVFEEYLSGVMLVVAAGLFIWAHKRRSLSTPLIYYSPVMILMLSLAQAGNTLWGFQMAWYLLMLALAAALFFLDRPSLTGLVLTAAIAAAVVGSFTSLQGLLIWPVGLVLLWNRRRSKGLLLAWVVSAVTTGAVYFIQFEFSATGDDNSYVFTHPIAAIQFFFSLIGDVGGEGENVGIVGHDVSILLGVAIVTIAIWVVIAYGFRRNEATGYPIGVALICFGLLFAVTITVGRTSWGLWAAGASRYTTFDLLILIGCYLAVLDRPSTLTKAGQWNKSSEQGVNGGLNEEIEQSKVPTTGRRWDDFSRFVVGAILMLAILLQIIIGTGNGLTYARGWKHTLLVAGNVTVNIDKASDDLVKSTLFVGGVDVGFIRQSAQIAKTRHLSLFATSAQAYYTKVGLPTELTDVHTRMINPLNGAVLKGTCLLDASASDMSGVTKVEFRLTDSATGRDTLIGVGKPTFYGWLVFWNSIGIANGTYELKSVAYGYAGKTSYSPAVRVTVSN